MNELKKLLSINGGGLYGVGVANWLTKFDSKWKPDYVTGTSVGSIIASLIAIDKPYEVIADMFNGDLPKKIFSKPSFPKNLLPTGYTYDNVEAKKVLKEQFGDLKVKDAKIPLIIVAWNYSKKKAKVFTHKYNSDYFLRDAVLASMSAPTYFPICELKDPATGKADQLGDGGVCGNDPSMAGIAAMREAGIRISDIRCLSLATSGWPEEKTISPGTAVSWLPLVVGILTLGNADYSSFCARQMLSNNYMQVIPKIPQGNLDEFKLIPKIRDGWMAVDAAPAIKFLTGDPPESTKLF
ncbi:MAG: patatin-like phospholipase family protein [Fibromonadaceae bacterium]|jgi:patatin-like phospholipase/acyl hydrolase|nr:patatin-like phospholipase family protein [Fibromonadaceae bacterium]